MYDISTFFSSFAAGIELLDRGIVPIWALFKVPSSSSTFVASYE